jgi:hypothetical protein
VDRLFFVHWAVIGKIATQLDCEAHATGQKRFLDCASRLLRRSKGEENPPAAPLGMTGPGRLHSYWPMFCRLLKKTGRGRKARKDSVADKKSPPPKTEGGAPAYRGLDTGLYDAAWARALGSANSESISRLNAEMSAGWRLLTQLPSRTTSLSTYLAPALRRSSWMVW